MKQEIVILKKESTGGNCALFPSSAGGRGSSADQQHIKALTTHAGFFSSLTLAWKTVAEVHYNPNSHSVIHYTNL